MRQGRRLVVLFLVFVFMGACMLSSCKHETQPSKTSTKEETHNSAINSSTVVKESSIIENEGQKSSSMVYEEGSKEWFFNYASESTVNNKNDNNTMDALEYIEKYYPYIYNAVPGSFDSQTDKEWFSPLLVSFGYFYKFFDSKTNGGAIGLNGLECLYAYYSGNTEDFKLYLQKVKDIGEDLDMSMSTKILIGRIEEGQYKVGIDIQPGEYVVFCDSSLGYFSVTKDPNGDDIIFNETFDYNSFFTVKEGEYVKISGAYAYPVEGNEFELDTSGEGMFRVGIDIPAGEYKVTADDDHGYYCIYKNSRHGNIVNNDFFSGSSYIKIKDGQYLILDDCHIIWN
ncbi:MAG: hypothetical protein IKN92_05770 [Clostridia bacterium]|nr:hypothetical protein [Clostridia bacterium]